MKVEMRDDPNAPTTVIGIVRDVKNTSLGSEVEPAVYWPPPELPYSFMTIVVRTDRDPLSLVPEIQRLIHSMDPDQPIARVRTMEEFLGDSTIQAEFNMILMVILATVAMMLALVGIYGVMSYTVLQRVQEIGVRMALGASSRDVLRLVLKQGGILIMIGSFIGVLASVALTRLMKSLLFDVSTTDVTTFAAVTGLLIVIALIACWIPARRAASVDPLIALRAE
jgi:putative ABC transport system permease protein